MFNLHISKGGKFVITLIVVLTLLVISAMVHFLNRTERSVYDNVLTEQVSTDRVLFFK